MVADLFYDACHYDPSQMPTSTLPVLLRTKLNPGRPVVKDDVAKSHAQIRQQHSPSVCFEQQSLQSTTPVLMYARFWYNTLRGTNPAYACKEG